MQVTTGPARYYFLRGVHGAKESVPNWPPEVKPLQRPDNLICVAVYLFAEEYGWRAAAISDEAGLNADAQGALLLTRETTLGVVHEGGARASVVLDLLGVRVVEGAKDDYVTHLVVRGASGGLGLPRHAVVVPVDRLVLTAYMEHANAAEAQLDLRLAPGELATMPPYLPDPVIARQASVALDQAILSARQRHEILAEVEAGRVTLYGRAELTTIGDVARDELERTPGVVEVVDRLVYSELLMEQVREALAAKGYGYIGVRYENGLIELDGTVPDMKTVHQLRDIALKVTGVRGAVVNQLDVMAPIVGESEVADEVHPANGTAAPGQAPITTGPQRG